MEESNSGNHEEYMNTGKAPVFSEKYDLDNRFAIYAPHEGTDSYSVHQLSNVNDIIESLTSERGNAIPTDSDDEIHSPFEVCEKYSLK